MEAKMYRMDWNGSGEMVEIKDVVLEIGQRVYGFLGYGGSESGIFIVAEEPDQRGNQLMVEIGGQHRFAYWTVGQDDQPLSKKFGIGYYRDDNEPGYRMPADEINRLRHQCEVQKAWNERLERNAEIASRERTEALRKEYGSVLRECGKYDDKAGKQNMLILLKREFPGVRFFCHKNSWKSYELSWTDGPTKEMVEPICRKFVDRYFNGMEDIEEDVTTEFNTLYGGIGYLPGMERKYSEAVWEKARSEFYEEHPEAKGLEDECSEFTPSHCSKFVKELRWPSPKSCIRSYLWDVNLYEKPIKKAATTVGNNNLQLIDYSEKAVAIIGNTRDYVAKLKELGGRFNGKLKCGAGWIFSKKKEAELREAFAL